MNHAKVLIVIPARGGSKGVPRKNMRLLQGKPLVEHAIDASLGSRHASRVVVSSEESEILEVAERKGVDGLRRPPDLARDNAQLSQVVAHVYNQFKDDGEKFDAVVSLQPTCPFILSGSIDRAVELLFETNCDSVASIAEMTQGHPYTARKLKEQGVLETFFELPEDAKNNRQNRTTAYCFTGGIYLRSATQIEQGGRPVGLWLGRDSRGVVVSELEAVDINSESDFRYAEFLLQNHG